ncbi:MAG TPA: hypothetical protein VEA80_00505 [Vitreimonas sp.]|uniref:hypothetical protein n=1 Tax=Vitreimonas sp. TaxID=3069702 RepID=UPI002D44C178|nr:hypothetical protein [Vitreimonas sp.]HYD85930.1 hypothetical protein [Vitreimonas sp.]
MKSVFAAVLLAVSLSAVGLAYASGAPAKQKAAAEEGEPAASSRSMDAPYLAVPVVRDGVLVNYLFVSVRVEIAQSVDLWRTRERAQFLRDALVRASHANDLAAANDDNALNEPLAIRVYTAAAAQALGERAVAGVSIVATYSSQGSGI